MKIGQKYMLRCGHLGTIVGVYPRDIAVKGQVRLACDLCYKKGENAHIRLHTVHIISKEEGILDACD